MVPLVGLIFNYKPVGVEERGCESGRSLTIEFQIETIGVGVWDSVAVQERLPVFIEGEYAHSQLPL